MIVHGILGSGVASEIVPDLWQGGYPRDPKKLKLAGIDVLVLAARELQNTSRFPDDLEIILAPLEDVDSGPTPEELEIAVKTAEHVTDALREGKSVLVSCILGKNRSGLINALVLIGRYGMSGRVAVDLIRSRRPNALTNPGFSAFLEEIK